MFATTGFHRVRFFGTTIQLHVVTNKNTVILWLPHTGEAAFVTHALHEDILFPHLLPKFRDG